ncbi:hypothetical protein PV755_09190 [Streptomyces caniscabiei]|uniref:Uncharacterized protein n=1 Tax=Streptomyces caniscabiei TaxID=2746961 RepID=A0A927QII2_9ACTN|nr:hypothetical protein [Streptomyces caniscabiei]MBD9721904.1 hypothetical protein [Streptomyces caniscabiei]MDX3509095.1 hypothetical protein [Streptomyces caniscabiei]MDX3717152.1 hypothetical protein [Streptomyces caniscabiei]WEO23019.1 hypothetical protein IHE65_07535 [Streptomyces caniscabiei]
MTASALSLETLIDSGQPIAVPGLARWLGVASSPSAAEPEETYEAFLNRISREAS